MTKHMNHNRSNPANKRINVVSFNGVSINSNDLLLETKKLFLREEPDFTPNDWGGCIFKKETLMNFLRDNYFDKKNKPSNSCLKEIKCILSIMNKASVMYLF